MSKEALPKIGDQLKAELASPPQLKHQLVQEKVVLPTSEDVQQEKSANALRKDIETFDSAALKHTPTHEKVALPSAQDIAQEKAQQ